MGLTFEEKRRLDDLNISKAIEHGYWHCRVCQKPSVPDRNAAAPCTCSRCGRPALKWVPGIDAGRYAPPAESLQLTAARTGFLLGSGVIRTKPGAMAVQSRRNPDR